MDIPIPEEIREKLGPLMKLSSEDYEALRAEWGNAVQGDLEGYDCPVCKNLGYVTRVDEMGNLACVECQCVPKRRSLRLICRSGLGDMLERYTLAAYQTPEPWQGKAKATAEAYLEHPTGWFAALGSVGSGKTHICTAICGGAAERRSGSAVLPMG